ncbi:CACTA en-spm transposon protein [Cucumis melo var. makuwa]|uniref:CACTA en-spm transposon protein n=1 Tax=Cucumis melo var. makuwa TaxID=1194695 RepID=A0A5A7VQ82_CUCMM|nr:CACTA en-spm transposon protein [Cucumis melo var. makuwa]
MKQNENFVTWIWDTRLFTRTSMTVYCIRKSLLISNIGLHVAMLGIMSYTRNNFLKTDTMFLEFKDDLDNLAGGSSSVGDNAGSSSQPPATPTPRRRAQSRLLVLERHVVVNGRISMTIAPREEKSTFSHAVRFSQWFFVLDFNDQAMNRFVKHQMLTTFKEFRGDCQSFKKYSDLEEARANPPNVLVRRHED